MTRTTPEVDHQLDKITKVEWKIIKSVETVIKAKWNAPTLKKDIEKRVEKLDKLNRKFSDLCEKMDEEEENKRDEEK